MKLNLICRMWSNRYFAALHTKDKVNFIIILYEEKNP